MKLPLEWTADWPEQEGTYLYYGDVNHKASYRPWLQFCTVKRARNGVLSHMSATHFLYRNEQRGVFARIEVEEPDLAALLGDS